MISKIVEVNYPTIICINICDLNKPVEEQRRYELSLNNRDDWYKIKDELGIHNLDSLIGYTATVQGFIKKAMFDRLRPPRSKWYRCRCKKLKKK